MVPIRLAAEESICIRGKQFSVKKAKELRATKVGFQRLDAEEDLTIEEVLK